MGAWVAAVAVISHSSDAEQTAVAQAKFPCITEIKLFIHF